jgi:hypothetical protein
MRTSGWTALKLLAASALLAGCQATGQQGAGPVTGGSGGAANLQSFVTSIRQSPQVRDTIIRGATGALAAEPGACSAGSAVLDRFQPLDARSINGVVTVRWMETVAIRGCPSQTYVRVEMTLAGEQLDGARLRARSIDRGSGLTTLTEYTQASRNARPLVEAALACTTGELVFPLTRFEGFSGPASPDVMGREARPWRETWLWPGCGKVAEVTVQFTPDRSGVAANADPRIRTRAQTPGERASIARATAPSAAPTPPALTPAAAPGTLRL